MKIRNVNEDEIKAFAVRIAGWAKDEDNEGELYFRLLFELRMFLGVRLTPQKSVIRLIDTLKEPVWEDNGDPFVKSCSCCGVSQVYFGKDGEHKEGCMHMLKK